MVNVPVFLSADITTVVIRWKPEGKPSVGLAKHSIGGAWATDHIHVHAVEDSSSFSSQKERIKTIKAFAPWGRNGEDPGFSPLHLGMYIQFLMGWISTRCLQLSKYKDVFEVYTA